MLRVIEKKNIYSSSKIMAKVILFDNRKKKLIIEEFYQNQAKRVLI